MKKIILLVFFLSVFGGQLFAQDSTAVKMIDSMLVQKQQSIQSFNQQGLQYDSEELVVKQEIESKQKRLEVIRDSKNQLAGAITILQEDIKALTEKKNKLLKSKQ